MFIYRFSIFTFWQFIPRLIVTFRLSQNLRNRDSLLEFMTQTVQWRNQNRVIFGKNYKRSNVKICYLSSAAQYFRLTQLSFNLYNRCIAIIWIVLFLELSKFVRFLLFWLVVKCFFFLRENLCKTLCLCFCFKKELLQNSLFCVFVFVTRTD